MPKSNCHRISKQLWLACAGLFALAASAPAQEATSGLARLLAGNQRFVSGRLETKDYPTERPQLTREQHPYAIIVACSDSRVAPELVFDESLGRLFVVRTAGHVIDPIALGSIEYAAEHLHVNLLFFLGHDTCGAVKATIGGGEAPPNIRALLRRIKPAVDKAYTQGVPETELLSAAIKENVRYQMQETMFESDVLSELALAKKLAVIGGVYHLQTGRIDVVASEVTVVHSESKLAATEPPAAPNQHAGAEESAAPAPKSVPKSEHQPKAAHDTLSHQARLADSLQVAYEKKLDLRLRKSMLLRDAYDRCATDDCRSIVAGERINLDNPHILSVMGRPQLRIRYKGRPYYILADPAALEVAVR